MVNPGTPSSSDEEVPTSLYLPESFRDRFQETSSVQLDLISALVRTHLDEVGVDHLPVLRRAVKGAVKFKVAVLSEIEIDAIQDALTAACAKILEKKTKEENLKSSNKKKRERALYSNEFSYSSRDRGAGQYYGRVRKPLSE